MIPDHFRTRLERLPLKFILFICGGALLLGFDRGGFMPTVWITAWAAFFTARLAINVKRKVESKQLKNTQA